jgi:hypothetical protein
MALIYTFARCGTEIVLMSNGKVCSQNAVQQILVPQIALTGNQDPSGKHYNWSLLQDKGIVALSLQEAKEPTFTVMTTRILNLKIFIPRNRNAKALATDPKPMKQTIPADCKINATENL